jgi:hypothetical protein
MDRRQFAMALAGLGLAGPAFGQTASLEDAAAEAWIYGLMLIENAAARTTALRRGGGPNRLVHARVLTTPATQSVTSPNNDTLYSRAWIDLAAGPVTLEMPAAGKRYVSYAFMDMYGTNFAILGTRTTGPGAHRVTLVGPGAESRDPLALRSPTRWVWLLIRTLIDDDADRAAANALQDKMILTAAPAAAPPEYANRDAPWAQYFGSVQELLNENPPPVSDLAFFDRVAPQGLKPQGKFDAARFSAADAARIEAGVAKGKAALRGPALGPVKNGWTYPKSNLGAFGQDYLFRAQIALNGLAALTVQEALYMRPIAPNGDLVLDASRPMMLRFEKGKLLPVNSFWSLTAYQKTPAGQFFFFDNPISRYAIGDRTPGLKYGADGSLEIIISRTDPGGARSSNWLPAPTAAPLSLSLRCYLPRSELIEGEYLVPALRPA